MQETDDVVFDEKSGISVEEQREILSKINGIAEKNRQLLSQGASVVKPGEKIAINAKKSGAVFPLVFNIAAVLIMLGGGLILISLNGKKDAEIRTGSADFNLTERALIEDIRRDADARNASVMGISSELDSAMRELDSLTNEQDRIAAIDAYMAGGFASINEHVQNSRFDQAAQTVESLRQFNNNNSVSSSRSFQSRREFYSQALNSLEAMISEVRITGGIGASAQQRQAQERNVQLEETVAEMQKTIDELNSSSSEQSTRLRELEGTVSTLESTVAARNRSITTLESTVAERNRTVTSLESTVAARDRTVTSLENDKNNLSQTITELQAQNLSKDQEIARLNSRINNILQAALEE